MANVDTSVVFVGIDLTFADVTSTLGAINTLNIEVLDYTSSALPFEITILGQPTPSGGDPTAPPPDGDRARVIEDLVLNTAINNPSVSDGMTFQFVDSDGNPAPISNGPGPDVIMFELGPPIGAPVPGGFMSVGGDPFVLQGVGPDSDLRASFAPSEYVQVGADGIAADGSFFSNVVPPDPAIPLTSLSELESVTLQQFATASLNVYAIAIDLSTLGFPANAEVGQLTLLSEGTMFGVDPALILGIAR